MLLDENDKIEDTISNFMVFLLFNRISENFKAVLKLINDGYYSQSKIIIRSMIEPLACMYLIKQDAHFTDAFIDNEKCEEKQLLEKLIKHGMIDKPEQTDDRIKELTDRIKIQEIKKLTTTKLLEDAKFDKSFLGFFYYLSPSVHTTASDLYKSINKYSNKDIKFSELKQNEEDFDFVIIMALTIMFQSVALFNKYFMLKQDKKIDEKYLEYENIANSIKSNWM